MRAFSPWPGAWFEHAGTRIKVIEAQVTGDVKDRAPGEVVDARLTIACGADTLRLLRVQREGKQAQAAGEFLRGYPLPPGTPLDLPDGAGGGGFRSLRQFVMLAVTRGVLARHAEHPRSLMPD